MISKLPLKHNDKNNNLSHYWYVAFSFDLTEKMFQIINFYLGMLALEQHLPINLTLTQTHLSKPYKYLSWSFHPTWN